MVITVSKAKALCTASELTLVRASTVKEIGKLSVVQVRQKVDRARKLRDKWRDQAEKQRRTAQATHRARQVGASSRSVDKAELFAEVVARFEAQLANLESAGQKGRPAPSRLPKRARSATHRADRADVRAELKEDRLALGGGKKPRKAKMVGTTKPKPRNAPAPEKAVAGVDSAAKTTLPEPAIPASKPRRRKRATMGTGMTAIQSARELQGLRITKGKQLRAGAAAKQSRIANSGLLRVQKNAAARNKRTQGKRDAR